MSHAAWPAHAYVPADTPLQYDASCLSASRQPVNALPPKLAAQVAWQLTGQLAHAAWLFGQLTRHACSAEWLFKVWWQLGPAYDPAMYAALVQPDSHGLRPWLQVCVANNLPLLPPPLPPDAQPNVALVQTPDCKRYMFYIAQGVVHTVFHVHSGKPYEASPYVGLRCVLVSRPKPHAALHGATGKVSKLPVVAGVGALSSTGSMLPSVLSV